MGGPQSLTRPDAERRCRAALQEVESGTTGLARAIGVRSAGVPAQGRFAIRTARGRQTARCGQVHDGVATRLEDVDFRDQPEFLR